MKIATLFAVLAMTTTYASTQTLPAESKVFHVVAIRSVTSTDSVPLGLCDSCWLVVSGTVGSLKYTTGQRTIGGRPRLTLTVGTDYPVDKIDARTITVIVGQDKKGRDEKERVFIMGTEELPR